MRAPLTYKKAKSVFLPNTCWELSSVIDGHLDYILLDSEKPVEPRNLQDECQVKYRLFGTLLCIGNPNLPDPIGLDFIDIIDAWDITPYSVEKFNCLFTLANGQK